MAEPLAAAAAGPAAPGTPGPSPFGPSPPSGAPDTAGAPDTGPRDRPPAPESLMQTVGLLWDDLRGVVSDRVELLALEVQRAGRALATIVAVVAAMVVLGLTAWLLLWATLVGALMALGLPGWLSLLLAMALNLGGLALALAYLRRQLPLLRLPATRRHLALRPSAGRASPPSGTPPHEHRPASPASGQPAIP